MPDLRIPAARGVSFTVTSGARSRALIVGQDTLTPPTFGSPVSGRTLTASGNSDLPASSRTFHWLVGAELAHVGPTFDLPEREVFRRNLTLVEYLTLATGQKSATSLPVEILPAAPAITGTIPTQTWVTGQDFTIELDDYVDGEGLIFTLAAGSDALPTGVAIESYDDSGRTRTRLIGPATAAAVGTLALSITAENDTDFVDLEFDATCEDPVVVAFETGDITVVHGNGQLTFTIEASAPGDLTDVSYRIDGGPWLLAGSTTTWTVTGLTNGQPYDVEFRPRTAAGDGEISEVLTATPRTVPATIGSGSWSVAPSGNTLEALLTIITAPANNGSPITGYDYRIEGGSEVSTGLTVPGAVAITVPADDVATDIEVRAINAAGPGAWSLVKQVTTTDGVSAAFTTADFDLEGLTCTGCTESSPGVWTVTFSDGSASHAENFTTAELLARTVKVVWVPNVQKVGAVFSLTHAGWRFWIGDDDPQHLPMAAPEIEVAWYVGPTRTASGLVFDSTGILIDGLDVYAVVTDSYGNSVTKFGQAADAFTAEAVHFENIRLVGASALPGALLLAQSLTVDQVGATGTIFQTSDAAGGNVNIVEQTSDGRLKYLFRRSSGSSILNGTADIGGLVVGDVISILLKVTSAINSQLVFLKNGVVAFTKTGGSGPLRDDGSWALGGRVSGTMFGGTFHATDVWANADLDLLDAGVQGLFFDAAGLPRPAAMAQNVLGAPSHSYRGDAVSYTSLPGLTPTPAVSGSSYFEDA